MVIKNRLQFIYRGFVAIVWRR